MHVEHTQMTLGHETVNEDIYYKFLSENMQLFRKWLKGHNNPVGEVPTKFSILCYIFKI